MCKQNPHHHVLLSVDSDILQSIERCTYQRQADYVIDRDISNIRADYSALTVIYLTVSPMALRGKRHNDPSGKFEDKEFLQIDAGPK